MTFTPGVNPYASTGGYLVSLKDALVQSMRTAFPAVGCPWPNFAGLYIDLQYPQEKLDYPGIWVDFEPVGNLTRSGIDQPYAAYYGSDSLLVADSRWRAQGYATFTLGALSSLERDLLYDIVISMIAFSWQAPYNNFRYALEIANPLLAVNINADTISNRGSAERPTTEVESRSDRPSGCRRDGKYRLRGEKLQLSLLRNRCQNTRAGLYTGGAQRGTPTHPRRGQKAHGVRRYTPPCPHNAEGLGPRPLHAHAHALQPTTCSAPPIALCDTQRTPHLPCRDARPESGPVPNTAPKKGSARPDRYPGNHER